MKERGRDRLKEKEGGREKECVERGERGGDIFLHFAVFLRAIF